MSVVNDRGGLDGFSIDLSSSWIYAVLTLPTGVLTCMVAVALNDLIPYDPSAPTTVDTRVFWTVTTLGCGIAFYGYSCFLLRLERLVRPAIRDHLRQCALFYVLWSLLAFLLVTLSRESNWGDEGGDLLLVGVFIISSYAILVNALTLFVRRFLQRCDSEEVT